MNSKLNELTLKGGNLGAFFAPYLCYSPDGSKRYTLFTSLNILIHVVAMIFPVSINI